MRFNDLLAKIVKDCGNQPKIFSLPNEDLEIAEKLVKQEFIEEIISLNHNLFKLTNKGIETYNMLKHE